MLIKTTLSSKRQRANAARGVWVKGQMALFDVRVFNPIAKVYLTSDLPDIPAAYRRNELEKKRVYGRRVRMVDQASFTPLVFSCLGGMGKESLVFYKRLANSLNEKRNQEKKKQEIICLQQSKYNQNSPLRSA